MRNEFDTIVVGGGLSGLVAAIVSARRGKKTALLTKGAGTLVIGGGVVDLLGYAGGKPVRFPYEGIKDLPGNHPYALLGVEKVKEAVEFFKTFTAERSYPYLSYEDERSSWLPTAIGTLKPTFLRPEGMNPDNLKKDHIVVLGVEGLKDFFPELLVKGLSSRTWYRSKTYSALKIPYTNVTGRDLSALDIARFVDLPEGQDWLLKSLKGHVPAGSALIIPPILGTKPQTALRLRIQNELSATCMETSVMPPSVTSLRLRELLMAEVKKLSIEYIEMAEVIRADTDGKRCSAIYTNAPDKQRRYAAENFIIATGGFFGGGCIAAPGKAWESIFKVNLEAPALQEDWSHEEIFSREAHPFALMGVKTDKTLRAVDKDGEVLFENVLFCGRTLGGYDLVQEKSGNGVALCTGYAAGAIL